MATGVVKIVLSTVFRVEAIKVKCISAGDLGGNNVGIAAVAGKRVKVLIHFFIGRNVGFVIYLHAGKTAEHGNDFFSTLGVFPGNGGVYVGRQSGGLGAQIAAGPLAVIFIAVAMVTIVTILICIDIVVWVLVVVRHAGEVGVGL